MRTLLNLVWFFCCGLWLWIAYVVAGIIACAFIVTIPIGVASFRMASYAVRPFGRSVVRAPDAGPLSGIANVVWFVIAGWWLALGHLLTAVGQAMTIIGIPLAIANLKMIPVTCFPYGKVIVPNAVARGAYVDVTDH